MSKIAVYVTAKRCIKGWQVNLQAGSDVINVTRKYVISASEVTPCNAAVHKFLTGINAVYANDDAVPYYIAETVPMNANNNIMVTRNMMFILKRAGE